MKIGLICPYSVAKGGGVQETVRAMQQDLARRGFEAKIITPEPRDIEEHHRTDDTIFVGAAADFKSPLHTTSQISFTADMGRIEQMLSTEQFDILHFHEPWVPMLSRQILSRSRSVNIATFHAKLPETVVSRTLAGMVAPYTKAVLKNLHELTAVSEAAAQYVRSLTDEPVTIIPNGVDTTVYKQRKSAGSETKRHRMILYVGRLERRKGVSRMLDAYHLLCQQNSDLRLVIAGDGPDRRKLEMKCADLELPRVEFLGYVSEQEKLRLMSQADLFCAPALYGESFGIVLLEAMACGIVTVAGNNPGYSSVLRELGSLSLINPKDPAEFARRMDVMLNNDELRAMWKKWATSYVKQYSYPRVVDRYVEIYEAAHKKYAGVAELA